MMIPINKVGDTLFLVISHQSSSTSSSTSSNEQTDTQLSAIVDAWPTLSDAIKAAIVAMVSVVK